MWLDLTFKYTAIFTAIILHEIAHGYAALLMGDDTAKKEGRLSLNPLKHADLFGTFLLPLMLWIAHAGIMFGWAKPVPIDFRKLKYHRKGIILVSAAGIIMNIWVAVISALFILLIQFIPHPYTQMILHMFFLNMAAFNIIIALFNALPIPPLDGSHVIIHSSERIFRRIFSLTRSATVTLFLLLQCSFATCLISLPWVLFPVGCRMEFMG